MPHTPTNACISPSTMRRAVWAMVLMLALPLIAASATNATTRQIEQQECPPGTVLDLETAECVSDDAAGAPPPAPVETEAEQAPPPVDTESVEVEPASGPVETNAEEPEPDLTNQPPEPDAVLPVTITIVKRQCLEGIDPATATDDELVSFCDPSTMPTTMTLEGPGGTESVPGVTDTVQWSDRPAGLQLITESDAAWADTPIVWCTIGEIGGLGGPRHLYPAENGTIGIDLQPNQTLRCEWYGFWRPAAHLGTSTFWCSLDPDSFAAADEATLTESCTAQGLNSSYRLSGQLNQDININGRTGGSIVEVPHGDYRITRSSPADIPDNRVFCQEATGVETSTPAGEMTMLDGYEFEITIDPDTEWTCVWFLNERDDTGSVGILSASTATPPAEPTEPPLPPDPPSVFLLCGDGSVADPDTGQCSTETPVPAQTTPAPETPLPVTPTPPTVPTAPPEGAAIYIQKYTCPEGAGWYDAPVEELLESCAQMMDGVEFSLQDQATGESLALLSEGGGTIFFGNLSPGWFTVTESLPHGFGEAIIFCEVIGTGGGIQPVGWVEFASGNSIDVGIAEGQTFHCLWYNIPVEEEPVLARDNVPSIDAGPFSCRWLELGRVIRPRIPLPAPQLPGSNPRLDPSLTNPLPVIPEPSGNLRLDKC